MSREAIDTAIALQQAEDSQKAQELQAGILYREAAILDILLPQYVTHATCTSDLATRIRSDFGAVNQAIAPLEQVWFSGLQQQVRDATNANGLYTKIGTVEARIFTAAGETSITLLTQQPDTVANITLGITSSSQKETAGLHITNIHAKAAQAVSLLDTFVAARRTGQGIFKADMRTTLPRIRR